MRAVDHERKSKCDWPKYLRRHTIPREPSLVVFHNYLLSKYILLSLYDFVHFADSVQLQSWWKLVCFVAKLEKKEKLLSPENTEELTNLRFLLPKTKSATHECSSQSMKFV